MDTDCNTMDIYFEKISEKSPRKPFCRAAYPNKKPFTSSFRVRKLSGMKKQPKLYTAQDAAQELECTDARIRQICGQPGATIGRKHGTAWILTPRDLQQIRKVLRKFQKT